MNGMIGFISLSLIYYALIYFSIVDLCITNKSCYYGHFI